MLYQWFLIGFFILIGCSSPQQFKTARPFPAPSYQRVEIGLCEDYPKASRSIDVARGDLLLLKTNGIHVLRIAFPWDTIEIEPGKYDWSFWDEFVRMAADEYGIRLIPYVCYTPRWNSSGNDTNYWRQPPKDISRFADFMKVIARRYKGRIHSWELWNEPDNAEYWEGSSQEFAELAKAGSKAVREADPTAKIVLGGMSWNIEFLRDLFVTHGISPFIDVVNLHNYYETWSPDPIENINIYISKASQIIDLHGNGQALWLAEVGYSNFRHGSHVSRTYEARYNFEHTPQFQAQSMARMLSSILATGKVQLIAWYRIHDLPETTLIIGDVNNRRLGILDVQGRPKPALKTLRFFSYIFENDFRCLDGEVIESRLIRSDSQAHVFEQRNGSTFVTVWLEMENFQSPQTITQSQTEQLDLLFPKPLESKATVYNERGELISRIRLDQADNRTAIKNLTIDRAHLEVIRCLPKNSPLH
ncbi:glycoside hydrolase family 39 [Pedosphaera parvula Ellin514]|uniref:Glycoside hydrolase family 39 n=2 Tax=Pedosphaera TaxID=1032526 RepID=B9XPN7_PEDPL|nr:glycoside hydrolase family 39 [Pedosphaera parvula Ellin514]